MLAAMLRMCLKQGNLCWRGQLECHGGIYFKVADSGPIDKSPIFALNLIESRIDGVCQLPINVLLSFLFWIVQLMKSDT